MGRLVALVFLAAMATAQIGVSTAAPFTAAVYFTGIGCPHCARTDPVLFRQQVRDGDLLVVEYEIYQDNVNAPLLMNYSDLFGDVIGIPAIIAGHGDGQVIVGDRLILAKLDTLVDANRENGVPLPATSVPFDQLDLAALWGKPKIWFGDRAAVRIEFGSTESEGVKAFILDGVLPEGCAPCADNSIALSGDAVTFREAYAFNGWVLMRD